MTEYLSKVTVGDVSVEFQGDRRYDLDWSMFKNLEVGYPTGRGEMGWGGHSLTTFAVYATFVTDESKWADEKLFDFLSLCRTSQTKQQTVTLTMEMGGGTITCVGWITSFTAPRDAPTGEATIDITFNFTNQEFPIWTSR